MKILQVLLVLAGTALFFVTDAQNAPERKEWSMRPAGDADQVQFTMESRRFGSHWRQSSPVPWSALRGITREQVSQLNSSVKFEYVRDAGKMICEGTVHLGRGSGSYVFQADPAYKAELSKFGFHLAGEKQEMDYFLANVSLDYARAVQEAKLGASSEDLYEMRIHGISREYIAEIREAGYTGLNSRDLIELKNQGVSTQFLRDLRKNGYELTTQQVVELRNHGVDTQFMSELKKSGYNLDVHQIVEMKNHGVSREDIQRITSYGVKPSSEDLVKLKNHGVSPEYLRALKLAGYPDLDVDAIVSLRSHGVSTEFIRQAHDLGYQFNTGELTDLSRHGVDGSYLRKLKDTGFNNLPAGKIIQLRSHGVD